MGQPTAHLYGNLQTIATDPAAGGGVPPTATLVTGAKVRIELSNYGPLIPSILGPNGGTLAKGTDYAAQPTTAGDFSTYLFRNDQITPIGTFYTIIVEDEDGNVLQCGAYRFNSDGDFDLATLPPIDAQDPPPPLPPSPPYSELLVIPYSTDIVFDGTNYTAFEVDLAGDVTTATTANLMPGNLYTITYLQDAVGNRAVAWPSNVFNWTDVSPVPNTRTTQTFVADENQNLLAVSAATWWP